MVGLYTDRSGDEATGKGMATAATQLEVLILDVRATGLTGKAKRKRNCLSSVHSEGSVGHRGSWVFLLAMGLGSYLWSRFAVSDLVHRIPSCTRIHVGIQSLKEKHGIALQTADLGAYAHGTGFGINNGRAWHCFTSTSCFVF